jgi:hypothetical protein
MERIAEASPRFKARIAGVFYLLTILARVIADAFVRNRLVVSDAAAVTATNIMAHEPSFRLGFAADIIAFASYIALTALLYELFKPVNRSLSLVAAFFSRRMAERWEHMTPEERDRFRQSWRGRWGFCPSTSESKEQ